MLSETSGTWSEAYFGKVSCVLCAPRTISPWFDALWTRALVSVEAVQFVASVIPPLDLDTCCYGKREAPFQEAGVPSMLDWSRITADLHIVRLPCWNGNKHLSFVWMRIATQFPDRPHGGSKPTAHCNFPVWRTASWCMNALVTMPTFMMEWFTCQHREALFCVNWDFINNWLFFLEQSWAK